MYLVSTREFRSNQGAVLNRVNNGEDVLLTSRYGTFKITPVTEDDKLLHRKEKEQAKMKEMVKGWMKTIDEIKAGTFKGVPAKDLLNEL